MYMVFTRDLDGIIYPDAVCHSLEDTHEYIKNRLQSIHEGDPLLQQIELEGLDTIEESIMLYGNYAYSFYYQNASRWIIEKMA